MTRAVRRALLALLSAAPAAAQEPTGLEAGAQATLVAARHDFFGGGATLGLRPGDGLRLVLGGLAGSRDGRAAFRGELLGQLMLTPDRRRGIGVYGLGGVAATLGSRTRADLVLGIGVETSPAGGWGLALEGGVGGGARLAVGLRRRWLRTVSR